MSSSFTSPGEPDPLAFATLCLVVGFVAGLGLGVAALASGTSSTHLPEER